MTAAALRSGITAYVAWPANLVCDQLGIKDANERGVVRMLVNTMIWTTLGVIVVVWAS